MASAYVKRADGINEVWQTGPYKVLRLRFVEEQFELDEDGDEVPCGGYSVYDWVVVDKDYNIMDFIEADSVLAEYWELVYQRIDEYEQQHPEQLFGQPEQLYFIREGESA